MIDVNDHQQEEVVMYEHTKFKAKLNFILRYKIAKHSSGGRGQPSAINGSL